MSTAKKLGCGCLLVVLAFIMLVGVAAFWSVPPGPAAPRPAVRSAPPSGNERAEPETKTPAHAMRRGEVGVVAQRSMVGVTSDDFDRITELSLARDATGLSQMQAQGRLLILEKGTRVKVIDPGFFSHEIRVLSGPSAGHSGMISVEFVTPE